MRDLDVPEPAPITETAPQESGVSPVAPAQLVNDLRTRMLDAVDVQTKTAALPERWGFCHPSPFMRQLTCPPAELLGLLRKTFSEEELLRARVALAKDDVVTLNRVFGADGEKFLRRGDPADPQRRPINVLSARGELCSEECPALRLSKIARGPKQLAPQRILLVDSDDALQVFQALGWMSVPCVGWASLPGQQVRKYFAEPDKLSLRNKFHLTLVGWDIARVNFTMPPNIVAILEHLARISECYDLDAGYLLDVWRPHRYAVDQIATALRFQDEDLINTLLQRSLDSDCARPLNVWFDLQETRQQAQATNADVATLRRKLAAAIRSGRDGMPRTREVRLLLQQLMQAMHGQFIDIFLTSAHSTSDPAERALLFLASEVMAGVVDSCPLVRGAQILLGGDPPPANFERLSPDLLAERMKFMGPLLQLQKALLASKS